MKYVRFVCLSKLPRYQLGTTNSIAGILYSLPTFVGIYLRHRCSHEWKAFVNRSIASISASVSSSEMWVVLLCVRMDMMPT